MTPAANTLKPRIITIELPNNDGLVMLQRCDDAFFCKAREISIPISLPSFDLVSHRDLRHSLPKTYAVLTTLTGPTGKLYDDWKGAFAFPFKVKVFRKEEEFHYLLKITNVRSMIDSTLYRISKPEEEYSPTTYHPPFPNELSEADLEYIGNYLCGFIKGYSETMPAWATPFVMDVQSNFIIYGYDPESASFFEEQYDKQDEFTEARCEWREQLLPNKENRYQLLTNDFIAINTGSKNNQKAIMPA